MRTWKNSFFLVRLFSPSLFLTQLLVIHMLIWYWKPSESALSIVWYFYRTISVPTFIVDILFVNTFPHINAFSHPNIWSNLNAFLHLNTLSPHRNVISFYFNTEWTGLMENVQNFNPTVSESQIVPKKQLGRVLQDTLHVEIFIWMECAIHEYILIGIKSLYLLK